MAGIRSVSLWESCHIDMAFYQAVLAVGQGVDVRPITQKRRMAFLKRIPALFLLISGYTFGRNRSHPAFYHFQDGFGLRIVYRNLAIRFYNVPPSVACDPFKPIAGQSLIG